MTAEELQEIQILQKLHKDVFDAVKFKIGDPKLLCLIEEKIKELIKK